MTPAAAATPTPARATLLREMLLIIGRVPSDACGPGALVASGLRWAARRRGVAPGAATAARRHSVHPPGRAGCRAGDRNPWGAPGGCISTMAPRRGGRIAPTMGLDGTGRRPPINLLIDAGTGPGASVGA
ncbi:hypothetical protein NUM_64380 [Actinocatenispora comari]|uniref:Uncharacterized protein n=1 Tax=Actinocatenispora comari TaxID=2807577 RepID=A0A8J4AH73_9ACTN|nr:hypothetical protein NUM_64380 [Actinocatenispora comari]